MNWNNWNWNSYKAAGKHVASYAAGGVTVAVATGLLNSTQGADATADINLIVSGIESLAKGIVGIAALLIPLYTMWKAAQNASPVGQATGLRQAVPGTLIVTTPELAAATPNDENIVSHTDVKVMAK